MRQGAISEEAREWIEEWENVSPQTNYIIRLDARGDERQEGISGPRTFKLSTEERIITQDRIAAKKNDPFTNGAFRPVVVPEAISVETNPNALSDDDIARILRASPIAWDEYMKVVDSPGTLRRMLERFESLLDEGHDLSARRLRQLQAKLDEVAPRARVVQKDRKEYEKLGDSSARPDGRPSMRAS